MPAESPLEPGWGALPSVPRSFWAHPSCLRKVGFFYRVWLIIQAFKFTLSVNAPFHPLAQILCSSVSHHRSRVAIFLMRNCYSVLMKLLSPPRRLPTADESTRSWIGCGEIHTFVSHCSLRSMSKYYFIWSSHFVSVLSDIWCASELRLALSCFVDGDATGKGPRKSLEALGNVTYLPFLLQALISHLRELIFAPNVFNNIESLTMGETGFSEPGITQTSRFLAFKGDFWFLHQVTHDTGQLLFLSGIKMLLRGILKGLRRFRGHQIVFKRQHFDGLIITK